MTFQQFCQQVLGQSAAVAKQMNDLWLVYASGKVKGGDTPASGGTLSGELLHNDSEDSPEKDTSGGDSASSDNHSDSSSEKTPGGSGSESTGRNCGRLFHGHRKRERNWRQRRQHR